MTRLISFDIDGTMVFGQPPGHVTLDMVRKAKELGYVVGSASDRTIGNQVELWRSADIQVDFVTLKHHLPDIRERFGASHYLHVGDTDMDRHFAHIAGFDFLIIHDVPKDGSDGWLLTVPSKKKLAVAKAAPVLPAEQVPNGIAIVKRPSLLFVGYEVFADDADLQQHLATAWRWLYERQHQITHRYGETFTDLQLPSVKGMHRHLVGAEVTRVDFVPEDMSVVGVPSHRYMFRRHNGARYHIPGVVAEMYEWAAKHTMLADGFRLDIGYLPNWEETYHDLLVRVHSPEDSHVSQA